MAQSMKHPGAARSAASVPLPDAISRLLARPDLRIAPHERSIAFSADLSQPFQVDSSGHVRLGPACLARSERGASLLRHALELAILLPRLPARPVLAGLAAARVAAVFAAVHGVQSPPDDWRHVLAASHPPTQAMLQTVWATLRELQADCGLTADAASLAALAVAWPLLGPTEALLQSGGDARLRVDPLTGLNFYGCSHRPRPWAVTFASSTASSSSERGFAGAEAARQRITLAALSGSADAACAAEAGAIRSELAQATGLPPGGAIVLAASGTDCELFALALTWGSGALPITSLLVAPEETGSGVPLAATGRHFAGDTARGSAVEKGALVEGFSADIVLAQVAARHPDGTLRPTDDVDAECARLTDAAVASGRRVVLHLLDISKTGFLAPSVEQVATIAARHPTTVRVVVDACQGRLSRTRIAAYLGRGWFVLITGSKFLTGPPFAGAVLIPPARADRLTQRLPSGLAAYTSQPDWPAGVCNKELSGQANHGLLLRWRAALAEWQALSAIPDPQQRATLAQFCARVRQGIAENPDLTLLEMPPPPRPDDSWDGEQTILSFLVRPADPLTPEDARRVYQWLNADLRDSLPPTLSADAERLACLRCHIGQPVPLPGRNGRLVGALRISAGARLVSGEPSHHDLDEEARLLREIRDALSVLAKISLILSHWNKLLAGDPKPSF